jgi:PKD repeat protein
MHNISQKEKKMKNKLLALIAVIVLTITGGIIPTPILLLSAQAVTIDFEDNGLLVIGVGKNVRGGKSTIEVKRGTKFYFKCREVESSYDYFDISGSVKTGVSASNGSRSKIYSFTKPGKYPFNITNGNKSYNDTITVIVK